LKGVCLFDVVLACSLCQQLEELEARQTAISAINSTKKKQLKSLPAAVKSVVEVNSRPFSYILLLHMSHMSVVYRPQRRL
jgi:hypothetical protein